ncbi:hypothetical protein HJB60_09345 [Rhizobium lentis]|uniref:Uncharacterized protein n=2 Tax=Rhizobium lentis TaxID=1138194 RepID=A0ABS7IE22_9HYPH|nr:hypothetical protein [Rhizobium lentis]
MMNWNTDLNGIPCGSMVTRTVTTKDGIKKYDDFQPDFVILASKCGKVIKSYWIRDERRFAGFKQGEQPVAWMRWPRHPFPSEASLTPP